MHRWALGMLSGTALALTMAASAGAQPLDRSAASNTSGLSVGMHLNTSAIRSPDRVTDNGGGVGLRLSYGVNQTVAFFLAYDAATLSARLMDYGVIHTDVGVRFSLANGTSATVPYVEGAFSRRAWNQAAYTTKRVFTGNAATFGGGVQHFVNRRIALDAGLLFSHGTFTDATVNGAPVPDYRGDAVWSSRFNLGGRMYFR
jgi:hypothetical protein